MNDSSITSVPSPKPVTWHKYVLLASCVHSGVWGIFIIALPRVSAQIYGFSETPHDIHLWQGTGLFISLLAVGYGLAFTNPVQHWGVVMIGLLAKVLGAIGMFGAVLQGQVSRQVLWLIPTNDLVWWIPFGMIVRHGFLSSRKTHV